jgi:hypothetical protein
MRRGRIPGTRALLATGPLLALVTACIPYTVGTTAQPVPVGDRAVTFVAYAMPSVNVLDSARANRPSSASTLGSDGEVRWGLDQRSDMGVRITSGSGVVLNYKRLLSDTASRTRLAFLTGGGIVNAAQHGHVEFTLLASGWEPATRRPDGSNDGRVLIVPYGGLRAMQVLPLAEGAVRDRPTVGAFFGARIGSVDYGVSPEIGVFYDHSAMRVRKRDIVVIPAIAVHGDRLIRALAEIPTGIIGLGRRRGG